MSHPRPSELALGDIVRAAETPLDRRARVCAAARGGRCATTRRSRCIGCARASARAPSPTAPAAATRRPTTAWCARARVRRRRHERVGLQQRDVHVCAATAGERAVAADCSPKKWAWGNRRGRRAHRVEPARTNLAALPLDATLGKSGAPPPRGYTPRRETRRARTRCARSAHSPPCRCASSNSGTRRCAGSRAAGRVGFTTTTKLCSLSTARRAGRRRHRDVRDARARDGAAARGQSGEEREARRHHHRREAPRAACASPRCTPARHEALHPRRLDAGAQVPRDLPRGQRLVRHRNSLHHEHRPRAKPVSAAARRRVLLRIALCCGYWCAPGAHGSDARARAARACAALLRAVASDATHSSAPTARHLCACPTVPQALSCRAWRRALARYAKLERSRAPRRAVAAGC